MAEAGMMKGKRGLVMGVANDHSIAWGIARTLHAHGAEVAFSYQGDAQSRRLKPLADSIGSKILLPCDVEDDAQMDAAFDVLKREWKTLDFVVHAIAFSDRDELKGRYVDTSRDNFVRSLLISCYSFTAVARRAKEMMPNGGSLITLSHMGAQRVIPNYNVMGVAKAALESSVRYLAADLGRDNIRVNAIAPGGTASEGFAEIMGGNMVAAEERAKTTQLIAAQIQPEDMVATMLHLVSDGARFITGQTIVIDGGKYFLG